jgi:hypothetical protein
LASLCEERSHCGQAASPALFVDLDVFAVSATLVTTGNPMIGNSIALLLGLNKIQQFAARGWRHAAGIPAPGTCTSDILGHFPYGLLTGSPPQTIF